MHEQLIELEAKLRAKNLLEEAEELHELLEETEAIEKPSSWISRVRGRMGSMARGQWNLVQQEVKESKQVYSLLRSRAKGEIKQLDPVQKEQIRAQLLDVFKVVPGGTLAVANFVAPIPCSSWLTPALLMSLGLMPSSWKEAHVQHRLGKLIKKLEKRGHIGPAGDVRVILDDIDSAVEHRERMAAISSDSQLLALFDRDRNGVLDEKEQARMHAAIDKIVKVMRKRWGARIWFLYLDGDVSGPFTLPDIDALGGSDDTLLCRAGKKQWVPLRWVLREVEDIDRTAASAPS